MKSKELTEIWNDDKMTSLKEFITGYSEQQSNEQKLGTELLAIQYRIEDYIESESTSDRLRVLDFVKLYLKTFNVTQKSWLIYLK